MPNSHGMRPSVLPYSLGFLGHPFSFWRSASANALFYNNERNVYSQWSWFKSVATTFGMVAGIWLIITQLIAQERERLRILS